MSQPQSSLSRLFAELKRRKVFRVMAVYGATAFVILQVADLAFPRLGLPEWTITFILVATIVGFPIALVLAWAFESTPDGVKRTEAAAPGEITEILRLPASRRWPAGLLALAGVVLVFGGGWWIGQRSDARRPGGEGPTKSVAVLPFVDLSEAGDQEWFSDGLTEEILNSLAALPELKVTSRTSSFQFRGQDRDIKEIADTLGVAHVVEGSVRRIGDKLAVTAQLIRASDGNHLWSETYERAADDLFDVQRDVAERVATALDVYLDDEKREAMFRSGTRSIEAFESYLRGVEQFRRWHVDFADIEAGEQGQAEFERAMSLDPGYARAAIRHMDWYAHVLLDGLDIGMSQEEARAALMRDLEFASANAPDPTVRLIAEINAELFSPDWFRLGSLIEQLGARPDIEQAQDYIWTPELLAVADRRLARRVAEATIESDPLGPYSWSRLADLELAAGNPDRARALLTDGRRRAGQHSAFERLDWVLAVRGDSAMAGAMLEESPLTETDWPDAFRLLLYRETGDHASAAALARRIDELPAGSAIFIRLLARSGTVPFDLADTPNFTWRLQQAGIDLSDFGTAR
jgi:adenylate cyclase